MRVFSARGHVRKVPRMRNLSFDFLYLTGDIFKNALLKQQVCGHLAVWNLLKQQVFGGILRPLGKPQLFDKAGYVRFWKMTLAYFQWFWRYLYESIWFPIFRWFIILVFNNLYLFYDFSLFVYIILYDFQICFMAFHISFHTRVWFFIFVFYVFSYLCIMLYDFSMFFL